MLKAKLKDLVKHADASTLAIDPGETVGLAAYSPLAQDYVCYQSDKFTKVDEAAKWIQQHMLAVGCKVVIVESYRIYRWQAQRQSYSDLFTSRLIGAIESICGNMNIPCIVQNAHVAKAFVTNDKLSAWMLSQYCVGKKHARDALRHLVYYMIFGPSKAQKEKLHV